MTPYKTIQSMEFTDGRTSIRFDSIRFDPIRSTYAAAIFSQIGSGWTCHCTAAKVLEVPNEKQTEEGP